MLEEQNMLKNILHIHAYTHTIHLSLPGIKNCSSFFVAKTPSSSIPV